MSVIPMKKLTAFVPLAEADRLTRRLQKMRCVQISQVDVNAKEGERVPPLRRFDTQERLMQTEKVLADIEEVCGVLGKYGTGKKGLFPPPIGVTGQMPKEERAGAEALVREAKTLLTEKKQRAAALSRMRGEIQTLQPWEALDLTSADMETQQTVVLAGTFPPATDMEALAESVQALGVLTPISADKNARYATFLTLKANGEEAQRALGAVGFVRINLNETAEKADAEGDERQPNEKEGAGASLLPAERVGLLQKRCADMQAEDEAAEERLKVLAGSLETVKILSDEVASEREALRVQGDYARTQTLVVLQGWAPVPKTEKVGALLTEEGCAWEFSDPAPEDDVPILLKNNLFAESFELVLGMYSYPKYGTYDPTFIMSIFYFIMFGMMFADVGYGLLLVLVCFGLLKFTKVRGGLRKFLAMFGFCGISCTVCGVLFGGYFSDFPIAIMKMVGLNAPDTLAITVDPLKDSMKFLIISLAAGAVHLIAGMAVKFVLLCKQGKAFDAICDIATYWLLFLGIGAAVAFPGWGKWVAIAGAASIVLTQGRAKKNLFGKLIGGLLGLYGVVNYVSDLLSYSRILALGLASAVVGQVVNTLATLGGPTPFGFVLLVPVFLIGHTLNIAINLLGTFVHTARLQYIEFFGKFYEDGGSPFKPVAPVEKYTEQKSVENVPAAAEQNQ